MDFGYREDGYPELRLQPDYIFKKYLRKKLKGVTKSLGLE